MSFLVLAALKQPVEAGDWEVFGLSSSDFGALGVEVILGAHQMGSGGIDAGANSAAEFFDKTLQSAVGVASTVELATEGQLEALKRLGSSSSL